jgi:hypothetical protein
VTPAIIKKLYGIKSGGLPLPPDPTGDGESRSRSRSRSRNTSFSQAVAEFQGNFYAPKDLERFFSTFVPGAPAFDAQVSKIVGPNVNASDSSTSKEASLDVQ